jgi:two-component system OmpR family sensor kinase
VIAPSRRLLLRIYVVSLAQLLVIAGTIALVGWLTFKFDPRGGFVRDARYAIAHLAAVRNDPDALRRELTRIEQLANAKVSLYGADGALIASNVSPPLGPMTAAEQRRFHGPEHIVISSNPPPVVTLPLDPQQPRAGYAMYLHAPPRHPQTNPALWAAGIALVGAAVASVVLARSFVTPLSLLTSAARKLGAGDLTTRVHSDRRDEFGQLADAFDDMADRLTLVLRSQQELLANVSHELRTPLARIRVALDLAAEGDASTAQESLQEITEDLGELERLVADVLQTAKLDLAAGRAGTMLPMRRSEHVDAHQLLDSTVQRFRSKHPERTLLVPSDASLPSVTGDAVLLRRALDNLLENARAYSDEDAAIELRAEQQGEQLAIAVIDRGIGIAASDLPNVATPFFRTDPSRARRTGGLGLGLSLARRIVEAHRGTLHIESELGRGTTIRILLPVETA